ncbi:MAG: flippase [Spirochaetales bacterium]|nr:flippase [Spirochaetales bacterium]
MDCPIDLFGAEEKMHSRTRNNFFLYIAYNIVSTLSTILATALLARRLGSNGIGEYSYLISIVSYFTLFAILGSSNYGAREIAYTRDNKIECSRVFWEIVSLRTMQSILCLLSFFIFISFTSLDFRIMTIFAFFIVNVAVDIMWFYTGIENFIMQIAVSLATRILYLLALVVFIRSEADFPKYCIIEVLYNLIMNGTMWFGLRKRICSPGKIHPLRHLRPSIQMFLPAITIQIYNILDKTMLGVMAVDNYNQNAYYSLAEGIVKSFLLIGSSLTKVTAPRIANLSANNRTESISDTLYESYNISWLVSLPMVLAIIMSSDFIVAIYFGPGYSAVSTLIKLLSPLVIFISLSSVSGNQYLIPTKHTDTQTKILATGALTNLILNFTLIPRFQAIGATAATLVAEGLNVVLQLIVMRHMKTIKIGRVMFDSWRAYIATAILAVYYVFVLPACSFSIPLYIAVLAFGLILYIIILAILNEAIARSFILSLLGKRRSKEEQS